MVEKLTNTREGEKVAVYQVDALVIRSREYGEADRLLTLFSREHGKLQAVAKGVRKPKSRQRGGTQLFTYSDFLLHRGKTLNTISQASPKESFRHIWDGFEQSLAASAMAELLEAATIEGDPHPDLFTLTLTGFFLLAHTDPVLLQYAFAVRLLNSLGYRPELKFCVKCGEDVQGERIALSSDFGGVVCAKCREGTPYRLLKGGSIAFMRQLLHGDFSKVNRLRWSNWMKQEIGQSIQSFCEARFEHTLKSWNLERDMTAGLGNGLNGGRLSHERGTMDGTGQD